MQSSCRVPSGLAASDTDFYLYYGDAAAAETNDADTWDSGFGLVLHMQEDPQVDTPPIRDSTANGNGGVIGRGSPATAVNDLWGGRAVEFFGADRLAVPGRRPLRLVRHDHRRGLGQGGRLGRARRTSARAAPSSSTTTPAATPDTPTAPAIGCSATSPVS